MILADDEAGRRAALAKLLPFQRRDFAGIFEAMAGLPVTIRLLDPPLHEFLPHEAAAIKDAAAQYKMKVEPPIGTMIELPRAALTAGKIAAEADFFSFGTNDLTQTTYGLSRDDAGKFLPAYVERHVLPGDPFVSIDQEGVGELITIAVERGRKTSKGLKIGVCGEHGGDPDSVEFCHRAGLDYVSCSPFRVPIARLAAAHAALKGGRTASAGRATD